MASVDAREIGDAKAIVQMLLPWIFCTGTSSLEASLLENHLRAEVVNTSKK